MGLMKRFNYQWKLFLPLVSLLWFTIGGLFVYQYVTEYNLRRSIIEDQLENFNSTIIAMYEQGADLQELVETIDELNSGTSLDELRITVYKKGLEDVLADNPQPTNLYSYSDSTLTPDVMQALAEGKGMSIRTAVTTLSGHENLPLMYQSMVDRKQQILSIVALPLNDSVAQALNVNPVIWVVVLVLGLMVTLLAYVFTRRLSRSVVVLRDFAERAAGDEPILSSELQFQHDELGDVSRRIVELYRAKAKALDRSTHDHQLAMRAQQEKERVKRLMTNNLNHELKTPVGVIKGYLDTICSDPDMPEQLRDSFLHKAQQHTDRLAALLQDVSTLTRLTDGGAKIELTDFDFHDLMFDLSNDLEVSGTLGNMTFDSSVPFDTIVHSNLSLVTNALMNLVRNAVAYSHGTQIELRLVSSDQQSHTFTFADNGVGVAEQHLPMLFERFYRVDEGRARKSGGTGLGLAIVKSTFTTLGGDITVGKAEPHGLCFTFTLPRASTTAPEATT